MTVPARRSWLPSGELARVGILWRGARVRRYLRENAEPRLHLGCGRRVLDGWLNADKFAPGADAWVDAARPLPFGDAVFCAVLAEHLVEHLRIERVRAFLGEVRRVLRPGGVARMSCPDLGRYARAYVDGDGAFFEAVRAALAGSRVRRPDLHWVVRGHGGPFVAAIVRDFHHHRWMYDGETLRSCLREVGFEDVQVLGPGEGRLGAWDDPGRAFESLYVEATR